VPEVVAAPPVGVAGKQLHLGDLGGKKAAVVAAASVPVVPPPPKPARKTESQSPHQNSLLALGIFVGVLVSVMAMTAVEVFTQKGIVEQIGLTAKKPAPVLEQVPAQESVAGEKTEMETDLVKKLAAATAANADLVKLRSTDEDKLATNAKLVADQKMQIAKWKASADKALSDYDVTKQLLDKSVAMEKEMAATIKKLESPTSKSNAPVQKKSEQKRDLDVAISKPELLPLMNKLSDAKNDQPGAEVDLREMFDGPDRTGLHKVSLELPWLPESIEVGNSKVWIWKEPNENSIQVKFSRSNTATDLEKVSLATFDVRSERLHFTWHSCRKQEQDLQAARSCIQNSVLKVAMNGQPRAYFYFLTSYDGNAADGKRYGWSVQKDNTRDELKGDDKMITQSHIYSATMKAMLPKIHSATYQTTAKILLRNGQSIESEWSFSVDQQRKKGNDELKIVQISTSKPTLESQRLSREEHFSLIPKQTYLQPGLPMAQQLDKVVYRFDIRVLQEGKRTIDPQPDAPDPKDSQFKKKQDRHHDNKPDKPKLIVPELERLSVDALLTDPMTQKQIRVRLADIK